MNASAADGVAEIHGFSHPDDGELEPVAAAFATKYGTAVWAFVVRDGAFAHRRADGRALVFRVRPVRGLGFRKCGVSSQTTWRFPC